MKNRIFYLWLFKETLYVYRDYERNLNVCRGLCVDVFTPLLLKEETFESLYPTSYLSKLEEIHREVVKLMKKFAPNPNFDMGYWWPTWDLESRIKTLELTIEYLINLKP